jgi:hypothetical protein
VFQYLPGMTKEFHGEPIKVVDFGAKIWTQDPLKKTWRWYHSFKMKSLYILCYRSVTKSKVN